MRSITTSMFERFGKIVDVTHDPITHKTYNVREILNIRKDIFAKEIKEGDPLYAHYNSFGNSEMFSKLKELYKQDMNTIGYFETDFYHYIENLADGNVFTKELTILHRINRVLKGTASTYDEDMFSPLYEIMETTIRDVNEYSTILKAFN